MGLFASCVLFFVARVLCGLWGGRLCVWYEGMMELVYGT